MHCLCRKIASIFVPYGGSEPFVNLLLFFRLAGRFSSTCHHFRWQNNAEAAETNKCAILKLVISFSDVISSPASVQLPSTHDNLPYFDISTFNHRRVRSAIVSSHQPIAIIGSPDIRGHCRS